MKDKPGEWATAQVQQVCVCVCVCVRGGEGVGVAERKVCNLDDPVFY